MGFLLVLLVGVVVFTSGCTSETTNYVCPDGSVVNDISLCSLETNGGSVSQDSYCGDGECQSEENPNSCPQDCETYRIIGIRSFDYDKNLNQITALTIYDPNYDGDWTLTVKAYDTQGNLRFDKTITSIALEFSTPFYCSDGCTSFAVNDKIPFFGGGSLGITLRENNLKIEAVGDYLYSSFENDISFSITYTHYDFTEENVVYRFRNTGKRIIPYTITQILYEKNITGVCEKDEILRTVLILDKNGDGIAGPGENTNAIGNAPNLEIGKTYCASIIYGFKNEKITRRTLYILPNQPDEETNDTESIIPFDIDEVSRLINRTYAEIREMEYTNDLLFVEYASWHRLGVRENNQLVFNEQKTVSNIILEHLNNAKEEPDVHFRIVSRYIEPHVRTLNLTWEELVAFKYTGFLDWLEMSELIPDSQT